MANVEIANVLKIKGYCSKIEKPKQYDDVKLTIKYTVNGGFTLRTFVHKIYTYGNSTREGWVENLTLESFHKICTEAVKEEVKSNLALITKYNKIQTALQKIAFFTSKKNGFSFEYQLEPEQATATVKKNTTNTKGRKLY